MLKKVTFDPTKNNIASIVIEQDDYQYWEMRAIELIREARGLCGSLAEDRLIFAIQLLTMALAKRTINGRLAKEE